MAGYGDILKGLAGGPAPAAQGVGMGPPPDMPGLPPPPTMTGTMPTGDPGTTKKDAADNAILSLREAKGHFPALGQMLDATVDALKAASQADDASTPLGKPSPPGAPPANPPPPDLSGSPGML